MRERDWERTPLHSVERLRIEPTEGVLSFVERRPNPAAPSVVLDLAGKLLNLS